MLDKARQVAVKAQPYIRGKDTPSPLTVYLEGLAPSGRRSMRSLIAGAADALDLEGSLERIPWHYFEYHDVMTIRSRLLALGRSANTVNATLAGVRGVIGAAFNMGLMSADDYLRIKQVKRVQGHRLPAGRSLTKAEISTLRKACHKDDSATGIRDSALLAVMVSGGLRRAEVVSLQLADYAPRTGELKIDAGKGNKQRALYLSSGVRKTLRRWLAVRGRDPGPLFCRVCQGSAVSNKPISSQRVYVIVRQRAEEAGIPTITPHDLRRTFITRLLENGVDLNTVRRLAGHKEIQTTVQYDRRDYRVQKKAMRSLDTVG